MKEYQVGVDARIVMRVFATDEKEAMTVAEITVEAVLGNSGLDDDGICAVNALNPATGEPYKEGSCE